MPSERNKTKRWQFSLRDLFVLTILAILPIVAFMGRTQVGAGPPLLNNLLFFTTAFMGGGLVGGMVGWTCIGTRIGFLLGFGIGGPCIFIGVFAIWFYLMLHLPG